MLTAQATEKMPGISVSVNKMPSLLWSDCATFGW